MNDDNAEGQSKRFTTTEWSLVLAAVATDSTESREALESLCGRYWYPVYAEIRFAGHDSESARDLTQGFFAQLLERKALAVADPDRGKFRNFLKTSIKNYLSHQAERDRARKRGGGVSIISLDFEDAEKQYRLEPAPVRTPEEVFDQLWAHAMLRQVLDRLREEMDQAGSLEQFDRLVVLANFPPAARGVQRLVGANEELRGALALVRLLGRPRRHQVAHGLLVEP